MSRHESGTTSSRKVAGRSSDDAGLSGRRASPPRGEAGPSSSNSRPLNEDAGPSSEQRDLESLTEAMTSGRFTVSDRQLFRDRTLRDPVFHQQVLDQLKELPRKRKKARELRKHYESIPKHLRDRADPRDKQTRFEEEIQSMRINEAQASRYPSQKTAHRGSGQPGRGQASDGPAPLMDVSQAQQNPLAGRHPAPPDPIAAERAARPGPMQQPKASAGQSEGSVADEVAEVEGLQLIRLIATNKATKDQTQLFDTNVIAQGSESHRLIDAVEQIYEKSPSSAAEVAQLRLTRVLMAIRLAKLARFTEQANDAYGTDSHFQQWVNVLHHAPESSSQIDIIDRIADNTADEAELREFASRLDLERGFKQKVHERLELYYARSRYDRSIQLRITMFRLSLLTDLTWKAKEYFLLRCEHGTMADCERASRSRRGQTPEAFAVETVWHPQDSSCQPGRSPAQGAAAAGRGGATAKEGLSASESSPARNVAIRGGQGVGEGSESGGGGAVTSGRAAAEVKGRGSPPGPKARAAGAASNRTA